MSSKMVLGGNAVSGRTTVREFSFHFWPTMAYLFPIISVTSTQAYGVFTSFISVTQHPNAAQASKLHDKLFNLVDRGTKNFKGQGLKSCLTSPLHG